ncbi:MAG: glycosyltransferase family 39 protein [Gemmatimonadota bacterium]|nr:MAG: glycosyltransferase family 39 protein [Gemmatimonadota bacterium]
MTSDDRWLGILRRWLAKYPPGKPLSARFLLWLLPATLLFLSLAITSLQRKSATFDEPVYVVAGLTYLTLHDYTLKEDAPPLVGYLAGLSPGLHGLRVPGDSLYFRESLYREYGFSRDLLYSSGFDADRILTWSRVGVLVPFGLLLLATVCVWATLLFGRAAGVFALFLTALSPNLIAHGRLVAADFPVTATMLFASFMLWRFTQRGSARAALASGFALGLALVTKYTALVLVPCFVIILAVYAARIPRGERLPVYQSFALVFLPAAVVLLCIYGWPPEPGRYVHGVLSVYRNIRPGLPWGYLFGSFYSEGVPWYYPAALAVKASLPLLGAMLAGLALIRRYQADLLGELCLLLPAVALLVAASIDEVASGIRRVLPLLPVMAILGSRWVIWERAGAARRLTLAALLIAFQAATTLATWPHYIPYFNEIARIASKGQPLLDDSNIDWGQDLKALPATLARHGINHVYLSYFGTADPDYYGIRYTRLPLRLLREPVAGVYAVSLQNFIWLRRSGPFWIHTQQPFDRAGTSILLFLRRPD